MGGEIIIVEKKSGEITNQFSSDKYRYCPPRNFADLNNRCNSFASSSALHNSLSESILLKSTNTNEDDNFEQVPAPRRCLSLPTLTSFAPTCVHRNTTDVTCRNQNLEIGKIIKNDHGYASQDNKYPCMSRSILKTNVNQEKRHQDERCLKDLVQILNGDKRTPECNMGTYVEGVDHEEIILTSQVNIVPTPEKKIFSIVKHKTHSPWFETQSLEAANLKRKHILFTHKNDRSKLNCGKRTDSDLTENVPSSYSIQSDMLKVFELTEFRPMSPYEENNHHKEGEFKTQLHSKATKQQKSTDTNSNTNHLGAENVHSTGAENAHSTDSRHLYSETTSREKSLAHVISSNSSCNTDDIKTNLEVKKIKMKRKSPFKLKIKLKSDKNNLIQPIIKCNGKNKKTGRGCKFNNKKTKRKGRKFLSTESKFYDKNGECSEFTKMGKTRKSKLKQKKKKSHTSFEKDVVQDDSLQEKLKEMTTWIEKFWKEDSCSNTESMIKSEYENGLNCNYSRDALAMVGDESLYVWQLVENIHRR